MPEIIARGRGEGEGEGKRAAFAKALVQKAGVLRTNEGPFRCPAATTPPRGRGDPGPPARHFERAPAQPFSCVDWDRPLTADKGKTKNARASCGHYPGMSINKVPCL
jgi:hypothetical protein